MFEKRISLAIIYAICAGGERRFGIAAPENKSLPSPISRSSVLDPLDGLPERKGAARQVASPMRQEWPLTNARFR
ncbi:hypothetical protein JTE90_014587 [Oedothorax gibbosus]|uniref:Uncharacterized protein n=1 Tax=Oedothorax gibbosus TaxID=931172 RepID=A0AAV6ULK2_9ARAC|nr:hypothetical protein JTE90_014587 [Oedothorax gibbosus]